MTALPHLPLQFLYLSVTYLTLPFLAVIFIVISHPILVFQPFSTQTILNRSCSLYVTLVFIFYFEMPRLLYDNERGKVALGRIVLILYNFNDKMIKNFVHL